MVRRAVPSRRRGATVVECAIVYPVTFLLTLGMIIGGVGIFRYQEVAALARDGARYLSTHGNQWRKDAGLATGSAGSGSAATGLSRSGPPANTLWYNASPTSASGSDTTWTGDMYDNAIRTNLVSLDPNSLKCQAGWLPVSNFSGQSGGAASGADNWPGAVVYVTVTYDWMPELFIVGPIRLQSTASCPITN